MKFIYTILLSTFLSTEASGQGEVISPGDIRWTPTFQGNGAGAITVNRPRFGYGNVGDMSLELATTGNMNDWAFFTRTMLPNESWGRLSELSTLSFDWFRSSDTFWNAQITRTGIALYDWQYKSPAFRVLLENDAELVWESYFNQTPVVSNLSYINTWQSSNMLGGNFWYRQGNQYSVITGKCSTSQVDVWSGLHAPGTIPNIIDCFGDRKVIGVAVGVGSQWPHEYRGYVDNVKVGFNRGVTVNANFDRTSTVPEPETYVMLSIGLFALGVVKYSKNRA